MGCSSGPVPVARGGTRPRGSGTGGRGMGGVAPGRWVGAGARSVKRRGAGAVREQGGWAGGGGVRCAGGGGWGGGGVSPGGGGPRPGGGRPPRRAGGTGQGGRRRMTRTRAPGLAGRLWAGPGAG